VSGGEHVTIHALPALLAPRALPLLDCLLLRYAGVAEWQTRMVQVHVGATP
jgi:hypothetical protein